MPPMTNRMAAAVDSTVVERGAHGLRSAGGQCGRQAWSQVCGDWLGTRTSKVDRGVIVTHHGERE